MNTGVHRVTANSKAGRQFNRTGKTLPDTASPEIKAWNKEVERKKKEKKNVPNRNLLRPA